MLALDLFINDLVVPFVNFATDQISTFPVGISTFPVGIYLLIFDKIVEKRFDVINLELFIRVMCSVLPDQLL